MSSSGHIYRAEKKLVMKTVLENNSDYIASISKKGDEYIIHQDDQNTILETKEKNLDERLWIVIKSTFYDNKYGHRLREGDKIKLGKIMFKVREMKSEDFQETEKNEFKSNLPQYQKLQLNTNFYSSKTLKINPKVTKTKMSLICRICLSEEIDEDDPLINPCGCTGSVRFIHLKCIRRWLNSKIVSKSFSFLTIHSLKNFECEICKVNIPERIKFRNEILSLVEYQKPDSNYVILESISREKRDNRYIYIIHMKNKHIVRLGRSNDSDIRLSDISVSRNHAILTLSKGNFYLQDSSSKFGTSVQLQNEIFVIPGKPLAIQCSKLFLMFFLSKTCIAWLSCYHNKLLAQLDYNIYLADKQPSYYLKELDCLNVIDTNFSISNMDLKSSLSKKSERIDTSNNIIEPHDQLHTDQDEIKEKIKESKTANEESLMADLNNVMTRNLDNLNSNRNITEILKNEENFSQPLSNVMNTNNITPGNSYNAINVSHERENDFLLDRFKKKNDKNKVRDKNNKNFNKSKTKGAENVTADVDFSNTNENNIDVNLQNEKKKSSMKNIKYVGLENYGIKKSLYSLYAKNEDHNSVDSEKMILKENKIFVDKYKKDPLQITFPELSKNNSLILDSNVKERKEKELIENNMPIKIKNGEEIIDSIFSNSFKKEKIIPTNNFIENFDYTDDGKVFNITEPDIIQIFEENIENKAKFRRTQDKKLNTNNLTQAKFKLAFLSENKMESQDEDFSPKQS
jgi:hypothetical protein